MEKPTIEAGSHYRDRNYVVVLVHSTDSERETVTYSPVGQEWAITTAMIIFQSRFIRFEL
ncbi:DUF4222 domain-containing protein [Serratia marcescens]|uniref:DUF4222 domain-containing protein n=1 Tax=Serratia marcescens TaxID=615 RepID=UPI00148D77F4|nr:DUF4222 domain-containing protein [Serratia marcescens]QJU40995.1 DUF4222 domain-containing protein [Serratia marcescens]